MSTVLILNSPELSNTEIFGFTHHNRDTLLQIYYGENCSDFKYVYTDKEGNGVFIEDFANKRAYLNFLKEHKKNYDSVGYILKKDLLTEISVKLKQGFLLYIGSTDDLETYQRAPQIQKMFTDINEKTIFQEKICYKISK